jgi:hypothetical protein
LNEECDEKIKDGESLRKRDRTSDDDDDEVEQLWENMEVVKTESVKRKKISKKSK